MSKNSHNKLSVLSNIPVDLIELCTAQRIKLLAKMTAKTAAGTAVTPKSPKFPKKLFSIALAAVLLLTLGISAFFIFLRDGRQIPVYQGMTVSSESPAQLQAFPSPYRYFALYDTLSPDFALLAHKEQGLHDNRPNKKTTAEDGTVLDPEAGAPLFYANQNEDFYITVHIDNPDNFEIVSFTLNGQKYSSYMFEAGSDMENLILKCNVGDASGIVEYTIDAIKYIDGTEIKDVRLEGDQTVKIGVYTANQPAASLVVSRIGFGELELDIAISDPAGLLGLQEYEIRAVLYKGSDAVDSQPVSIDGTNAVRFTGLDDGTEYRVAVVADYDSFNGAGKLKHSIGEKTVSTPEIVTVQIDSTAYTEATYKLTWHENATDKNVVSFALYQGDQKIRDVDPTETKLTGLLSSAEYALKVEYTQDGKIKSRSVDFQTKKVEVPTLQIVDYQPDLHSLSFKLERNDPLRWITIDKIELLQNGNVIATATEASTIEFTNLDILQTYSAQITYSYDLRDGKGKQTKTFSKKVVTQSKGLKITGSGVAGIGTCTDDVIYINMEIAYRAFYESDITEIVLGSNAVLSTDSFAYSSLTKVTMHYGITRVESGAFYECKQLKEIVLPDSVTAIGSSAFYGCEQLEELIIPDSVTRIEDEALSNCPLLTDIIIPASVTTMGQTVFGPFGEGNIYCEASSKPGGWSTDWHSAGYSEFWDLKEFKTDAQGVTYMVQNDGKLIAINFDDSTTTIVLPNEVIRIAKYAFHGSSIQKITIPSGVIALDEGAFSECTLLNTVILNEGLLTIGDDCFSNNRSLADIILPSTLTSLGARAFGYCQMLKQIEIPAGVTELRNFTFYECPRLGSVTLPNTLKTIGYGSFSYCGLRTIILPDSLISIGDEAFRLSNLEQIKLPANVSEIGAYAFFGTTISQIVIPASVKKIGEGNFGDSADEILVFCEAKSKPSGWKGLWVGSYAHVYWNVAEFHTDSQGVTYAVRADGKLIAFAFDNSTDTVVLPNGVIEVAPYAFSGSSLKKITIPSCVTALGKCALQYCADLKTVILNEGLTSIGSYCFAYDSSLTNITLPSTLTSLGACSFLACKSLESITIPNGITDLAYDTFSCCSALSKVTLPASLKTIDHGAFRECLSLRSIVLPNGLTSIGYNAFMQTSLERIVIPLSVSQIGEWAFESDEVDIYCVVKSKPSGWDEFWGSRKDPNVVWGYTGS